MTTSYHVWFSARSCEDEEELVAAVHRLMADQLKSNEALAYRLHRFYDKAGSETLCDFQLVVDYDSRESQKAAMKTMAEHANKEPHATVIRLTGEFRPAWSEY